MNAVLRIQNLSKNFKELRVLEKISLGVKEKELVAVIGPSGCGKTTLLRLIAGLASPTRGKVEIGLSSGQKKAVAIMFQQPNLLPWRTVVQNIRLALELSGGKVSKRRLSQWLKLMKLEGFEDYYPAQISLGMQQRTALVRTLINRPALLLLDEPFSAVDAITRHQLQLELLRVWQRRLVSTIVLVTHSISEAAFLADRVVVLSDKPTRVKHVLPVDLPKPRQDKTLNSTKYLSVTRELRKLLAD